MGLLIARHTEVIEYANESTDGIGWGGLLVLVVFIALVTWMELGGAPWEA